MRAAPPAHDRIRYDDLFDSGDPENKAFWASAMPAAESLVGSFVTVEGEPPPAGSAAPATRRPSLAPAAAAVEQPTGTVTLLFTDVEGSTRLLDELGPERYAEALMVHRGQVRSVAGAHAGVEMGTEGDAFFFVFQSARDGLLAAGEMQAALGDGPLRVRMGIHTGEVLLVDGDYVGMAVHKAARISSAAHGGQVVVSAQTGALAGVALRDLGEHRLKDLTAPERLFQLGDEEFPPLRTLRRAHLPVQATPLIGRERELGELIGLAETHRLITLTGTGGTGKTRLALALAAELADRYADGVWWVPMATVTDPSLLTPAIAGALGDIEDVATSLNGRELLLLIDNMEQVIDAAPVITGLVTGAAGCAVIVTSRERLAVAGEQEYPVPPLSGQDAVELFTARAREVKPGFEPGREVDAICERLDRLPLRSSSPLLASRSFLSLSCSLGLSNDFLSLRACGGMSPSARARCGPRSLGATTCSVSQSSGCSPASPCSSGASSSRPQRRSVTPVSMRSNRSSTRASCDRARTGGSSFWRQPASTHSSGSR